MRASVCFCGAAVALLASGSAFAHSDVLLRDVGGKVAIGAAEDLDREEGGPFFDLDTNVFEGILINPGTPTFPLNFDFERDEPGFFTGPGLPVGDDLPTNTLITITPAPFSIGFGNDAVHYWDGNDDPDFQPLSVAQPGVTFEAAEDDPLLIDDTAFVDGHPIWGLDGGAADGVYLVSYTVNVPGLDPSDPFYMVWLAASELTEEDDAEAVEGRIEAFEEGFDDLGNPVNDAIVNGVDYEFFEEAVEFAEAIPEPTTAALALLALGAFAARRR